MKFIIINGPNLNLLGSREPEKYGDESFEEFFKELQESFSEVEVEYYQSNVEGELINKIQEVGFDYSGIILNAGGYTHTSVALADAVKAINSSVVEVHITNIYSREEFRQKSLLSPVCKAIIAGMELDGYALALAYLMNVSE